MMKPSTPLPQYSIATKIFFCPLTVGIVKYLRWREHPHRKWRMLWRQCVQTFYESFKTGSEVGKERGGNMLATRKMKSMKTLGISTYWTKPFRGLVCWQAILPVHYRAEQHSCSESLCIFFISGRLLTLTNFCSHVALQRLDDDVAASDASSAPSATSTAAGHTRRRTRQNEQP